LSRIRRNIHRKKLNKILRVADDEQFFTMMWSIHAAQTGREDKARPFLEFPKEAATTDMASKYAVHPWKCETLLNEALATPKQKITPGNTFKTLNCRTFSSIALALNTLTKLEDAEDGLTLKRVSVLNELHRLSQRQFGWQMGLITLAGLYRSGFIYGGPKTKLFFESTNEFSLNEFSLACFAIRAALEDKPAIVRDIDLSSIGISEKKREDILNTISIRHTEARKKASTLRNTKKHTGYKKSLFREYPCVSFGQNGERIHGPLPDLVLLRSTSGVFYDVINGGGDVRNEISSRFERYCIEFLQCTLLTARVRASFKYQFTKRQQIDSPDILVSANKGPVSLIIECKARRLSYEARFSEDPVSEARDAYNELSKGLFQIWRFVAHQRLGLIPNEPISADVRGIVLTLDTWLSAASVMQDEVFELANLRASEDANITEEDRIPVIFCPIGDLEQTLGVSTDSSFFETVFAATDDKFKGWSLSGVHRELGLDRSSTEKKYPFADRMADVFPWWRKQ
tara:strand:+ start:413 stop:1954 length:1542 start_codon:yes stop_codon:yes gene_type:complete